MHDDTHQDEDVELDENGLPIVKPLVDEGMPEDDLDEDDLDEDDEDNDGEDDDDELEEDEDGDAELKAAGGEGVDDSDMV
jgi:hypothetical protein